jgi:hypothetical protein
VTELTEREEEPPPPEEVPKPSPPVEPDEPHAEIARRNVTMGFALFGLSLLLFAGVWVVGFIYLALA